MGPATSNAGVSKWINRRLMVLCMVRRASVERNRRRPRGAAVVEHAPVRELDRLEKRRRLPVTHRRYDDRDRIAFLDHVELPAHAIEDAGVGALDEPHLLLLPFLGTAQPEIDVGVLPQELVDD